MRHEQDQALWYQDRRAQPFHCRLDAVSIAAAAFGDNYHNMRLINALAGKGNACSQVHSRRQSFRTTFRSRARHKLRKAVCRKQVLDEVDFVQDVLKRGGRGEREGESNFACPFPFLHARAPRHSGLLHQWNIKLAFELI